MVVLFTDTNKDHVVRTATCGCVVCDTNKVVLGLFSDTNKDHVVRTATCGCVVL